ncbi:MAG: TolC family protein [Bacteroidales bacterium]|nr:TolC family protein [Bacteroidales bacterium]
MKKGMLILVLTLLMGSAMAQYLTLDTCRQMALRNNASVRNADLEVQAAQELKKQAFTKYFPNVKGFAGGYYAMKPLLEYTIDDIGNAEARQLLHNLYFEYGAAMGLPNSISFCEKGMSVGAMAVQPIFMGGQIVNGNRLAQVGVTAAELQRDLARDELLLQVESSYWLVISLQEKERTLNQAITFLDTLSRDVNTALEAGLVTRNDQLKVMLKQNELASDRLRLTNGIRLAKMALCQQIGAPYSDAVVLTDSVVDVQTMGLENVDVQTAVQNRREAELLSLNVKAEQLKKKMTLGETLPHLMAGVGASYGNPVFDRFSGNGLAFATLQVPITDWWKTSHKLRQQQISVQKAENQREDLMQKMALETQQALDKVTVAGEQVRLKTVAVQYAEVNTQTYKVNFQAGMIPVSDLLEAQTLYRQAQDELVDAKIEYRKSLSALQRLLSR